MISWNPETAEQSRYKQAFLAQLFHACVRRPGVLRSCHYLVDDVSPQCIVNKLRTLPR